MTVSVVIPTINACPELLTRMEDRIRAYERTGTLDQYVVEAGGTFAENCNAGAKDLTSDILLFLNDDMSLREEDWLYPLLDPFRDPTVGITGAKLIYPNGQIQHAGIDPYSLAVGSRRSARESAERIEKRGVG